ncbi:armadillo-type protein [Cokeromyces recurvatus]|uniref:armadillo-type protein n=1 Tax=Cokeromyces recurvatus TaxID=90255 RepID=UPI00221E5A30|nr:armadillo-type protein [Cokeromyces recurvatus]KAI7900277.1 armadillo-type protein [Cokeromyces recurvatus]
MEKLLQWAVNNSDNNALAEQAAAIRRGEAKPDPKKFDPKIIEAILGKDDATRMKEAVECISNPEDTLENKEIALDNLELLIEGIDNARNIENMKLWPAIIKQLEAKEPEVRKGVAWVCGTAVQNNPQAQKAFLENGGLEPLLKLLKEDEDASVRNKAQYAISGFLKHHQAGVEAFEKLNGFDILQDILKTSKESNMVRKVVFLYNSLVFDDNTNCLTERLIKNGTLQELQRILVKYTTEEEDEDMVEKTLRTIHTIITKTNTTPSNELKEQCKIAKDKYGADNLGLVDSEWKSLL